MLTLYQQLFTGLLESQVEYCRWKNIQETSDALAGTGDIDLYISPQSHVQFVSVLRKFGFTRLISHKATPCVEHYYGYDAPSGKFCHLHCYFRIVTGESHIKQYVVPVEDYLSALPNVKNKNGLSEMHPLLQYKLNLFRRSIKLSCLPGALLFFRERRGYHEERFLLEQALHECPEIDDKTRETGWLARIQSSTSLRGEILAGIRYRIYFRHWSRFPALLTPVYRYGTILLRIAGKLRRRRKMFPMGIIIAVAGPSREDATEMENRIASWLGGHFYVVSVHDPTRLSRQETAKPDYAESENTQSLRCATGLLWRAFNRRRRINLALRQAMAGSIVIWRGQDPKSIRQAVETLPRTKNTQSVVMTCFLHASDTLLSANPKIDILLHLPGKSTAGLREIDVSATTGTSRRSEPPALNSPDNYPMQVTIGECISTCEDKWKHEVWQALVALQP